MAFIQRKISVTINLANGQFGSSGNSKTIQARDGIDTNAPRITAHIDAPGGPAGSTMALAIYGMSLSDMNQMSTVGKQLNYMSQNTVTVMAGDDQSGMSLVFKGIILFAFVDANQQPQVCLRLTARPGGYADAQTIPPTSIGGPADVATLMAQLASKGGFGFEGNGVSVKITRPYLWGSVGAQIRQLAQAGCVEHILDRGTLAIWNPGSTRGLAAVTLGPTTTPPMIDYPAFNQASVNVRSIFNPNVQNGGKLILQTSLTPAAGTWTITSVSHQIEANQPGGKWETAIRAAGIQSGDTP